MGVARGVLEAIFWKPKISWRVHEIWVLKPIRYFSLLRNEVNSKISERTVTAWQKEGGGYDAATDNWCELNRTWHLIIRANHCGDDYLFYGERANVA